MKIFRSSQVRELDSATIEKEPVLSINLMERAANQLLGFVLETFPGRQSYTLVAGPGNNGGDAIALARLLARNGKTVRLVLVKTGSNLSDDCEYNFKRLKDFPQVEIVEIENIKSFPLISRHDVVVEGIFGSGLTRSAEGFPGQVIDYINTLPNTVVSIDIPSGLFGEDNSENAGAIIEAGYTVSFQFPKLAFMMPENEKYVGQWVAKPIGLLPEAIENTKTSFYYQNINDIPRLLNRDRFAHKGHFGHALLVAGSYGKTGAAVLASRACIRSGPGLLSVHVPESGYEILQATVPEAMAEIDETEELYCSAKALAKYNAIGVGPGIGKKKSMAMALHCLLKNSKQPLVLDADALNIISENKDWLSNIPVNSILTPHPKEFDRLTGNHGNHYQRIESAMEMATKYKLIVVLKGANTAIVNISGEVCFNGSGNPALSKGGSGDVLTGIILGLLASGYNPYEAARLGVFVHGHAADLLMCSHAPETLSATDLIEGLPTAFKSIRQHQLNGSC